MIVEHGGRLLDHVVYKQGLCKHITFEKELAAIVGKAWPVSCNLEGTRHLSDSRRTDSLATIPLPHVIVAILECPGKQPDYLVTEAIG